MLTVVFDSGAVRVLDLTQYAARGGAFAGLADPEYARQFVLMFSGYTIRWPGDLDFCADAVFTEGREPQFTIVASDRPALTPVKGRRSKARA